MEGLQTFVERYDLEDFDYPHVFQEPLLLDIPLKDQLMITIEKADQIPCDQPTGKYMHPRIWG
jgi:hypothetical protein